MAEKNKEVDWPPCQLMVAIEPGPGARDRLRAALAKETIAAVLIRPSAGDRLGAGEVKPLIAVCRDHGCLALITDDVLLAEVLGADGVHFSAEFAGKDPTAGHEDGPATSKIRLERASYDPHRGIAHRVAEARAKLGTEASIGVDAGGSRHAAMDAAEAGCDYIAFGGHAGAAAERVQATDDDDAAANDAVGDDRAALIAWWAEIFEVPCVALDVATADEARRLAADGADFVAATLPQAATADDIGRLIADMERALDGADLSNRDT